MRYGCGDGFIQVCVLLGLVLEQGILGLKIETQLAEVEQDCFERVAVGGRIAGDLRPAAVTSSKECEKFCKDSSDCKTYNFGVGAKGNITCQLLKHEFSDLGENRSVIVKDVDYDVFARRYKCERNPPRPISTEATGSKGPGTTRPISTETTRPSEDEAYGAQNDEPPRRRPGHDPKEQFGRPEYGGRPSNNKWSSGSGNSPDYGVVSSGLIAVSPGVSHASDYGDGSKEKTFHRPLNHRRPSRRPAYVHDSYYDKLQSRPDYFKPVYIYDRDRPDDGTYKPFEQQIDLSDQGYGTTGAAGGNYDRQRPGYSDAYPRPIDSASYDPQYGGSNYNNNNPQYVSGPQGPNYGGTGSGYNGANQGNGDINRPDYIVSNRPENEYGYLGNTGNNSPGQTLYASNNPPYNRPATSSIDDPSYNPNEFQRPGYTGNDAGYGRPSGSTVDDGSYGPNGNQRPGSIGYDQPVYIDRPTPAYNNPPAPAYNNPPVPVYNDPPTPAYNNAPTSVYNNPPAPVYNNPSPAYNNPQAPVYNNPSPAYNNPQGPVYNNPSTPVYINPPAPVYNNPPAPVYNNPSPVVYNDPPARPTFATGPPSRPAYVPTDNTYYNDNPSYAARPVYSSNDPPVRPTINNLRPQPDLNPDVYNRPNYIPDDRPAYGSVAPQNADKPTYTYGTFNWPGDRPDDAYNRPGYARPQTSYDESPDYRPGYDERPYYGSPQINDVAPYKPPPPRPIPSTYNDDNPSYGLAIRPERPSTYDDGPSYGPNNQDDNPSRPKPQNRPSTSNGNRPGYGSSNSDENPTRPGDSDRPNIKPNKKPKPHANSNSTPGRPSNNVRPGYASTPTNFQDRPDSANRPGSNSKPPKRPIYVYGGDNTGSGLRPDFVDDNGSQNEVISKPDSASKPNDRNRPSRPQSESDSSVNSAYGDGYGDGRDDSKSNGKKPGVPTITEIRDSSNTCYRRVISGARADSRHVERVARTAGTLAACERACFHEPRFHCETFNFRLDPANGGQGRCELMTRPSADFKPEDLIKDALYDIYEVDRNSLLPDCKRGGSSRVVNSDGESSSGGSGSTGVHHHYHHHRHHDHEHPHVFYEERHPFKNRFEHRVHYEGNRRGPANAGGGYQHRNFHEHHGQGERDRGNRDKFDDHGYRDRGGADRFDNRGGGDRFDDHGGGDRFDDHGYRDRFDDHGGGDRYDDHGYRRSEEDYGDEYDFSGHRGGSSYGRRYGEGFEDSSGLSGWSDHDRQCSSRRRSGSSLGGGNIRKAVRAGGVLACETACYSESSFKCTSYSYRYSHTLDDNCFLSDKSYAGLGFSDDDYSDVFSMENTDYCQDHRKKGPWLESECFWLVRSDRKLIDGTSLSVTSLGACQAECVRSEHFLCRSFSFRFGPPSRGDASHNCVLSARDGRNLGPHDGPIETALGHELYARGSFGRGCEPLVEEPTQECFVVYPGGGAGARLRPSAVRASSRAADEDDCRRTCTLLGYCMSFSFDSDRSLPAEIDNCFMSDVRLRDLRLGVDYETSVDDWLFAFDMLNPECWSERHRSEQGRGQGHHRHGHRENLGGHRSSWQHSEPRIDIYLDRGSFQPSNWFWTSGYADIPPPVIEPIPPPLYPPLVPPTASLIPPSGPPIPFRPTGPPLPVIPPPIVDLGPHLVPVITGPPRPSGSENDLFYNHEYGYSNEVGVSGYGDYEENHRKYDIYDEGPGSWSVYTVKGYPCRAGTRCAPNHISDFWSCEIEGGEIGSWDYCCAPTHKCGYSDGVDTPWCYVGPIREQWRPCSDRYFPYTHQYHHHRDEHEYLHKPEHRPHGEHHHSQPGYGNEITTTHTDGDRKYWDDLYKNGPKSYYDEHGNPRPGYVRIPTIDKPRIRYHHNYGPDRPGDNRWVPVRPVQDEPQDFLDPPRPGGFDTPRYWPVAYLHREKPPNKTFTYVERPNSVRDRDERRRPVLSDDRRDYDDRRRPPDDRFEDRRRPIDDKFDDKTGPNGYRFNDKKRPDEDRFEDRRRPSSSNERRPYDDRRTSISDERWEYDERREYEDRKKNPNSDRRYDDRNQPGNGGNNNRPNDEQRPGDVDDRRRPSSSNKKPKQTNSDSNKNNVEKNTTTETPTSTTNDSRNGRKEEEITNASVAESTNNDDTMVLISSSSDKSPSTEKAELNTEKISKKAEEDDKTVTRRSNDDDRETAQTINDKLQFFDGDDEADIEVISLDDSVTKKTKEELLQSEARQIEEIGRILGARRRSPVIVEKRSQNENDAKQLLIEEQRNNTQVRGKGIVQRITKEQLIKEQSLIKAKEEFITPVVDETIINGQKFFDATFTEDSSNITSDGSFPDYGAKLPRPRNKSSTFRRRKEQRQSYNPKEVRDRLLEKNNRKSDEK